MPYLRYNLPALLTSKKHSRSPKKSKPTTFNIQVIKINKRSILNFL